MFFMTQIYNLGNVVKDVRSDSFVKESVIKFQRMIEVQNIVCEADKQNWNERLNKQYCSDSCVKPGKSVSII